MSLSGMVEIPRLFAKPEDRLQAKREFVMPVLRQSQDKLQPASGIQVNV